MRADERNKRAVREMVRVVWANRDLSALPAFWTGDCVNHADPGPGRVGLAALRAYHEGFLTGFPPALSDPRIEFVRQVAEGDAVASHILLRAVHAGPPLGHPPTGRAVSLWSMRIDRLRDAQSAEHWSVADMAGFARQLRS